MAIIHLVQDWESNGLNNIKKSYLKVPSKYPDTVIASFKMLFDDRHRMFTHAREARLLNLQTCIIEIPRNRLTVKIENLRNCLPGRRLTDNRLKNWSTSKF